VLTRDGSGSVGTPGAAQIHTLHRTPFQGTLLSDTALRWAHLRGRGLELLVLAVIAVQALKDDRVRALDGACVCVCVWLCV